MPAYVKVSGAWKQATTAPDCYVKVSGAWKKCSQVYVKVNGAWKPCYATSQSKTGPSLDGSVTLTGVQVGSTITITGHFTQYLTYPPGGGVPSAGYAKYSVTGASLTSSSGSGVDHGSYRHVEYVGGENYSSWTEYYTAGEDPPTLLVGPLTTDYTIKLKATSSTVKISLERTGVPYYAQRIKCTSNISYSGS